MSDESDGLYVGDAIDFLNAQPDDSIDLLFTSPSVFESVGRFDSTGRAIEIADFGGESLPPCNVSIGEIPEPVSHGVRIPKTLWHHHLMAGTSRSVGDANGGHRSIADGLTHGFFADVFRDRSLANCQQWFAFNMNVPSGWFAKSLLPNGLAKFAKDFSLSFFDSQVRQNRYRNRVGNGVCRFPLEQRATAGRGWWVLPNVSAERFVQQFDGPCFDLADQHRRKKGYPFRPILSLMFSLFDGDAAVGIYDSGTVSKR